MSLLERLKPSWFQMLPIDSGKLAHNGFSVFSLLINPVSLAGHPRLTAWRALCALLCMEAGHVQCPCWGGDLGRGDLSLLGSAPWGHSLPNTAASGSAWAADPAAQQLRGSLLW